MEAIVCTKPPVLVPSTKMVCCSVYFAGKTITCKRASPVAIIDASRGRRASAASFHYGATNFPQLRQQRARLARYPPACPYRTALCLLYHFVGGGKQGKSSSSSSKDDGRGFIQLAASHPSPALSALIIIRAISGIELGTTSTTTNNNNGVMCARSH